MTWLRPSSSLFNESAGCRWPRRLKQMKDLGETMLVAHALVLAEAGAAVIVIIDEGQGARLASSESKRLDRLRKQGRTVGSLSW